MIASRRRTINRALIRKGFKVLGFSVEVWAFRGLERSVRDLPDRTPGLHNKISA